MFNQSTRWTWLVCGFIGLTGAGVMAQTTVTVSPSGTGTQPVATAQATARPNSGDTKIAQALAKEELAKIGINHPTQAQWQAALKGGIVALDNGTSVALKGIWVQRDSGMGWGQIANAMGVKLGSLVSASRSEHAGKKEAHEPEVGVQARNSTRAGDSDGSHGNSGGNAGGNHGSKK